MPSLKQIILASAFLVAVNAQGVLVSAKGDKGTSLSLQMVQGDARDATIISQAELDANVVNECGRTVLNGNIDIGQNTENAIAAGNITTVKANSNVAVTINQVNATGAGPYTCDMDPTGNALGAGQTPLTVKQGAAKSATGDLTLTVTMPSNFTCIGASLGNVCTVRCKNAQNFGGCFPVQQTDVTPSQNKADTITSAQTLEGISAQIQQNNKDFPAAVAAIQSSTLDQQGAAVAEDILAADPAIAAAATSATPASTAAKAGKGANSGNGATKGAAGNTAGAKAAGNTAAGGNAGDAKAAGNKASGANADNAKAAGGNAGNAKAAGGNADNAKAGGNAGNAAAGGKAANNNKRDGSTLRWAQRA